MSLSPLVPVEVPAVSLGSPGIRERPAENVAFQCRRDQGASRVNISNVTLSQGKDRRFCAKLLTLYKNFQAACQRQAL